MPGLVIEIRLRPNASQDLTIVHGELSRDKRLLISAAAL